MPLPLLVLDGVSQAPQLPLLHQPGLGCHVVSWWFGILAPAQTPQAEGIGSLWPGTSCSRGSPSMAAGKLRASGGDQEQFAPRAPDPLLPRPDGAGSP